MTRWPLCESVSRRFQWLISRYVNTFIDYQGGCGGDGGVQGSKVEAFRDGGPKRRWL